MTCQLVCPSTYPLWVLSLVSLFPLFREATNRKTYFVSSLVQIQVQVWSDSHHRLILVRVRASDLVSHRLLQKGGSRGRVSCVRAQLCWRIGKSSLLETVAQLCAGVRPWSRQLWGKYWSVDPEIVFHAFRRCRSWHFGPRKRCHRLDPTYTLTFTTPCDIVTSFLHYTTFAFWLSFLAHSF